MCLNASLLKSKLTRSPKIAGIRTFDAGRNARCLRAGKRRLQPVWWAFAYPFLEERVKLQVARNLFLGSSLVLTALLIAIVPAPAYQRTLSSELVREAYFLGRRRDDATRKFLAQYVQTFPVPPTGPNIARIEVVTPYSGIVIGSEEGSLIGSVMDAEQQLRSHPALFLVHVWIYSTPTFTPGPSWDEFWQKIKVQVEQRELLKPLKTRYPGQPSNRGPGGTELELQFDAGEIASRPITIEVSGPHAKRVEAKFDLSKLK